MTEKTETAFVQIDEMYLQLFMQVGNSAGYTAAQRVVNKDEGFLWFIREQTTKPEAWLKYKFDDDGVTIAVQTRDDRPNPMPIRADYAEGGNNMLKMLSDALMGNRLQHKAA